MTMPSKIWVYSGTGFEGEDILAAHESDDPYGEGGSYGIPYIRADIAAELARVLACAVEDVDENGRYAVHWWVDDARAAIAKAGVSALAARKEGE